MERKPKIAILRWEEGLVPQAGKQYQSKIISVPCKNDSCAGSLRGDCHHASESGIA